MLPSLKLPLYFDSIRLCADLARVAPDDWIRHFNTAYYDGDWSGIPLRTTEGARVPLYPDPTATRYASLPFLDECPYFREVLASFSCPLQVVRLLRLRAGSSIREHRDFGRCFEDGEARIHVPILTDPDVAFYSNGERLDMRAGEAWYLNVDLPHRVENRSANDRVHLVIDCVVDPWLRSVFEQAVPSQA